MSEEKRGPGRPPKNEVRVDVKVSPELDQAMREIAETNGVKVRDVWRAAAQEYVGRHSSSISTSRHDP